MPVIHLAYTVYIANSRSHFSNVISRSVKTRGNEVYIPTRESIASGTISPINTLR